MPAVLGGIVRDYLRDYLRGYSLDDYRSPPTYSLAKAKENIENHYCSSQVQAFRTPLLQRFSLFAAERLFKNATAILVAETSDQEKGLKLQLALDETEKFLNKHNLDNHILDQGQIQTIKKGLPEPQSESLAAKPR